MACSYAEEADPEETESEAPQLVPLTGTSGQSTAPTVGKVSTRPPAASEGTPLLADRAGDTAHKPVGDAPRAAGDGPRQVESVGRDKVETSTLDGEEFVDLGQNAIIEELEPER